MLPGGDTAGIRDDMLCTQLLSSQVTGKRPAIKLVLIRTWAEAGSRQGQGENPHYPGRIKNTQSALTLRYGDSHINKDTNSLSYSLPFCPMNTQVWEVYCPLYQAFTEALNPFHAAVKKQATGKELL